MPKFSVQKVSATCDLKSLTQGVLVTSSSENDWSGNLVSKYLFTSVEHRRDRRLQIDLSRLLCKLEGKQTNISSISFRSLAFLVRPETN